MLTGAVSARAGGLGGGGGMLLSTILRALWSNGGLGALCKRPVATAHAVSTGATSSAWWGAKVRGSKAGAHCRN
jgi:hypothetical protein